MKVKLTSDVAIKYHARFAYGSHINHILATTHKGTSLLACYIFLDKKEHMRKVIDERELRELVDGLRTVHETIKERADSLKTSWEEEELEFETFEQSMAWLMTKPELLFIISD
jgi:hypothetical protein